MHWEEIWTGRGFLPVLIRVLLFPLSLLYALGWQCYLALYRLGIKKAVHPHSPIICVGNLVTGGSGKSPVVLHLADVLQGMGYEVVIGCSGYGAPHAEAATIAPAGKLHSSEWGDEPAMVRMLRPTIPLIVGRRRVLAADLCHKQFPNAVLLMDDGFQHLPLNKDISIVLDASPRNRLTLPAGPYREPWSNRRRADLVIPDKFKTSTETPRFVTPTGEVTEVVKANVLCALGSPQRVIQSLESFGVTIGKKKTLPDHDPLSEGNLFEGFEAGLPIVVTAKDWVKLRDRADISNYQILIAQHSVTIEPADEFEHWLQAKLDGKAQKRA